MPAHLPEFEYDIFISYRHNDDMFDGWVTDFVAHLHNELAGAIKGPPLRIYFDKDSEDGLGATHLVGPSLDHRLRSFILIPLISRTYCEVDKYSWKHEFLPFLQLANNDHLGLTLNLPNGGVASRILPLRIHNLEAEDKKLLEQSLGGYLRSIDFVYQELEVNRPLRLKDDDLPRPVGGSLYRNQINRVANSIKELIAAAGTKAPQSNEPTAAPVEVASPAAPAPEPTASVSTSLPPAAPVALAAVAAPVAPAPTGPVVFLAWVSWELKALRDELAQVCTKAGMHVVPNTDCPSDEDEFRLRTQEGLAAAVCALHVLGSEFGKRFEKDDECSFSKYAYDQARLQAASRPAFRQFVWYKPDAALEIKPAQQAFVNKIRNELTEQCTFSNAPSAMQLVADLRGTLEQATPKPVSVEKENDIFFVFNELDCDEATAITDRLGKKFMLDTLTIEPDTADRYKDMAVSSIPKSKLAVVYFKHSADWALPFVKQVWRQVGGAASTTPILFVGEDDPEQNRLRGFKAPQVISCIHPHLAVSEEVSRVFQQLNITTPA